MALVCLPLIASAQTRKEYRQARRDANSVAAVDLHAGKPLGVAGKMVAGADVVFLHKYSPAFSLGVGAGLDYIDALNTLTIEGKEKTPTYNAELSVPVFLRGRYMFGQRGYIGRDTRPHDNIYRERREGINFFVQADAGYRVSLGALSDGSMGKSLGKGNIKGIFLEPQAGISIGKGVDISLGLPFQAYNKMVRETSSVIEGVEETVSPKRGLYSGAALHLVIAW